MPDRHGFKVDGGWAGGTEQVMGNSVAQTLTIDTRNSNGTPIEYKASQWIEFVNEFESNGSDEFEAYIADGTNTQPDNSSGSGGEFNTYRYGFNGQEMDNEIVGEGNIYTAEFWQYDSRLGRRWNVDPVLKVWESSYLVMNGNPILMSDPNGDDAYSNNNKGDRSSNKYDRIFRRLKGKTGENDEHVHKEILSKYGNKSWMWVKNKNDYGYDRGTANANHQNYYYAGDIWRAKNNKPLTIEETQSQTSSLTYLWNIVYPSPIQETRAYSLPGSGTVSIKLGSSSGGWTYSTGQLNDDDETKSLAGPITVTPSTPQTLQFNVDINDGRTLLINISPPRNTSSIGFISPQDINITRTIKTTTVFTRPQSYEMIRSQTIRHPARLTRGNLRELQNKAILRDQGLNKK